MNARMGAAPWLARTQIEYADLLLAGDRRDDRQAAIDLLERASSTAGALDLVSLGERAERLLEQSVPAERAGRK